MSSDTTSSSSRLTIAISPSFSSDNSSAPRSEPTSDEQPDLGAFTTVLRAWTHFQPQPRIPVQFHSSSSSRTFRPDNSSISSFTRPGISVASGTESTIPEGSTVWAQRPIQSYLDLYSGTPSSDRLVEEDELEQSSNNDQSDRRQYGFTDSAPPSSPPLSFVSTEDGRTVEIASDVETLSLDDFVNLDRSLTSADMAIPLTVLSPNYVPSLGLHSSGEEDTASLTTREVPLRHNVPIHSNSSFQRSFSPPSTLLHRGQTSDSSDHYQSELTPQRSHFPIQEISSPYSAQTISISQLQPQPYLHSHSYWQSQPHMHSQSTSQLDTSSNSYNASHEYKSQANPLSLYSSSHLSQRAPLEQESAGRSLLQESSLRSFDSRSSSNFVLNEQQSVLTLTPDYPQPNEPFLPTPESGTHSLDSQLHSIDSQPLSLQTQPDVPSPEPEPLSHPFPRNSRNPNYFPAPSELSANRCFSPQVEPPSPLPTPEESETFPFSPPLRNQIVDEEAMDNLTPKRMTQNDVPISLESRDREELVDVLTQGLSHRHSYPHSLTGLHALPPALQEIELRCAGDSHYNDTHPHHSGADDSFNTEHTSDHDLFSGHSETEDGMEQPSLGFLDEALSFIAAERARFAAARESGTLPGDGVNGTLGPGGWRHVIEPRRKRRRKKGHAGVSSKDSQTDTLSAGPTRPLLIPADDVVDGTGSGDAEAIITVPPPSAKKKKLKLKAKLSGIFIGDPNAMPSIVETISDEPVIILRRPKATDETHNSDHNTTPTLGVSSSYAFSLNGRMGKRVGRRERIREKAKKDRERMLGSMQGKDDEPEFQFSFELGDDNEEDEAEDDEEFEDDEGQEIEPDFSFSSSSAGDDVFTRSSAASRACIHRSTGMGVYKSTPPTPGTGTPKLRVQNQPTDEADGSGGRLDADNLISTDKVHIAKPEKLKKVRAKRTKPLLHAKSVPDLRIDATLEVDHGSAKQKNWKTKTPTVEETGVNTAPLLNQSKRGRLQALARKLQLLFPEQKQDLGKVILRLGNRGRRVSASSAGKRRRGHAIGGSKGAATNGTFAVPPSANDLEKVEEDEEGELDPRGRLAREGDSLIHVFVDHSNILIGLLNHLKRYPPPQQIGKNKEDTFTLENSSTSAILNLSVSRPLPIPDIPKNSKNPGVIASSDLNVESSSNGQDYPIPLPSFATANANSSPTLSRSLPTESALDTYMAGRPKKKNEGVISDGYEDDAEIAPADKKEKKYLRHLWHTALVLILERGRPVTRRVVVTSSPLYQPMDMIEHLGYEVRVYLRVPDLGDGMDRERYKDKDFKYGSLKSSGGGKSAQSSPVKNISFAATLSSSGGKKGHTRHMSGSTSTESGSTPYPSIARIKYREQGVDELLQLKLHQALADTDIVPDGSTIVLATGDGNVGQFNEDGFLGPVRTALKRGWKVELYAWEDGLSRSWRREFGEGSEWARKGMFRIIGMEQFASGLVEAVGW